MSLPKFRNRDRWQTGKAKQFREWIVKLLKIAHMPEKIDKRVTEE